MNMKEKFYDYIIYPANLSGCIFAIKKAKEGASVLLLNDYGFPGGEITNSLCCYQTVKKENLDGLTKDIFHNIVSRKNSVFYEENNSYVLNPETIKISLQEMLELNNINLLFHVFPIDIKNNDYTKSIFLTAREGTIEKQSLNIIDTSENFSLIKFFGLKKKLVKCYLNIFLRQSSQYETFNFDSITNHSSIEKIIKLNDSRYWVSLSIPMTKNELFIENFSQEILNDFEIYALNNGFRVQLVAPQTARTYQREQTDLIENFVFHPKLKNQTDFSLEDIFMEANYFENELMF